jgi:hypothetical protein
LHSLSLFAPRVFRNSFPINAFHTLSQKCRVSPNNSHPGTHHRYSTLVSALKLFRFTLFRTLLRPPKTQPISFQSIPKSSTKTPGVGVPPRNPSLSKRTRLAANGKVERAFAHDGQSAENRSLMSARMFFLSAILILQFAPLAPGATSDLEAREKAKEVIRVEAKRGNDGLFTKRVEKFEDEFLNFQVSIYEQGRKRNLRL